MFRAHVIELRPNQDQIAYFKKACGTARFAYNWTLSEWKRRYDDGENPSAYNVHKVLVERKQTDFAWMYEVTKAAPQYAVYAVGDAFKRWWSGQSKPPRFKKKGRCKESFQIADGAVKITGTHIRVPRLGLVRLKEVPRFSGRMIKAVISSRAGRWFVAVQMEIQPKIDPKRLENQESVGVDLGLKTLATLSDGATYENPRTLERGLKRLKRLQRRVSRRKSGSVGREKARRAVAVQHYRILNRRKHALHNMTTDIVRRFDTIVVEDLNVSGIKKNRRLAMHISGASFYEIRRQLTYKAEAYGRKLIVADRFFPSSKTCSACGTKKATLTLGERIFVCDICGFTIDRDLNAAVNLKNLSTVKSTGIYAEGDWSSLVEMPDSWSLNSDIS